MVLSANGYRLFGLKNDHISNQIREHEVYDWATTAICPQFIFKGHTVFDIGANIGWFTSLFRSLVGRTGEVHAFEVHPMTFYLVSISALINDWNNVILNEVAIGAYDGELEINPRIDQKRKKFNLGGFSIASGRKGDHTVPVKTVDCYARERQLNRIDFIKIDVEGFEAKVIEGAKDTLRRQAPILLMELNGVSPHAHRSTIGAVEHLRSLDYIISIIEKRPRLRTSPLIDEHFAQDGYLYNAICAKSDIANDIGVFS